MENLVLGLELHYLPSIPQMSVFLSSIINRAFAFCCIPKEQRHVPEHYSPIHCHCYLSIALLPHLVDSTAWAFRMMWVFYARSINLHHSPLQLYIILLELFMPLRSRSRRIYTLLEHKPVQLLLHVLICKEHSVHSLPFQPTSIFFRPHQFFILEKHREQKQAISNVQQNRAVRHYWPSTLNSSKTKPLTPYTCSQPSVTIVIHSHSVS